MARYFIRSGSITFRSIITFAASVAARRTDGFRFSTTALAALVVFGLANAPLARANTVDLELVFAADGSGSIDD